MGKARWRIPRSMGRKENERGNVRGRRTREGGKEREMNEDSEREDRKNGERGLEGRRRSEGWGKSIWFCPPVLMA